MMLNADMALVKDLSGQLNEFGEASCSYQTCSDASETISYVQAFAQDNAYFLNRFSAAYQRMIEMTDAGLQDLES